MKAIIETGGKQYYVSEGDTIFVEKLDAEVGKKVVFDKVLMANGVTGNPYVKGVTVEGEVVKQGKGKTKYDNGDEYEGDYYEDKRQGKGIMKFVNGERYEGEFYEDMLHGKGLLFKNDLVYEGVWNKNNIVGKLKKYK